jgi:5-(aminomethyl)-3-furanmethanol phosphate kinase
MTTLASELYAGPGLRSFGVGTVVKFGGSLLADLGAARRIAEVLGGQSHGERLLVFPGGGPTDKLIESMARELGFGGPTINPACMRALDQTGILLAAMHPRLTAVTSLAQAREVLAGAHVPVLLPSELILSLDVFTREDVITSDSLGAYFAFVVGARRYVVLTDVDGVYESVSGPEEDRRLIETVTTGELMAMGATSVDRCLAPLLGTVRMPAWVLNGFAADRLAALLAGQRPIGTRIEAGEAR